ncbi:molybdate ABC transporter substrate-binding protein [Tabrizicola sp. M-4]|uniref:molybdate ABC transporter substrate-binding protein n=1 Tax=Tabrizicola sp. M-4 TaxID=3055847 RepID=UPI003DA9F929
MLRPVTLATALGLALATPGTAEEVVVFAAASMKNALDAVAADFQARTGKTVTISYGGSNALAKQIIEGAPAEIFLSAAENWMDEVEKAGLIADQSRKDMFGNALVLVAHGIAANPVEIVPGFDLAGLVGEGKLSMAMVDAVPAGQYGKEALENLGIWSSIEASVAQSENVRAALALVATGEAPFGIVYASDAISEAGVTVVGKFPTSSHAPIVYPGAVLTNAADPSDRAFFEAITSDRGDAEFAAQGFVILE